MPPKIERWQKSKCVEGKKGSWDGQECSCFVRWLTFYFVFLLVKFQCYSVALPLLPNGSVTRNGRGVNNRTFIPR